MEVRKFVLVSKLWCICDTKKFVYSSCSVCRILVLISLIFSIYQEVVEETMKNVPLLKEIVDYYTGPDRITAKRQQEELERVAKTIPANAPASVMQFADRAVLSLQVRS